MVDSDLLEQALKLDIAERRELVRALEDSFEDDGVSAAVLAEVDRRLAQMGPGPNPDAVPVNEFMRRVRARRSA